VRIAESASRGQQRYPPTTSKYYDVNTRFGLATFLSGVNASGARQCMAELGLNPPSKRTLNHVWDVAGKLLVPLVEDSMRRKRLDIYRSDPRNVERSREVTFEHPAGSGNFVKANCYIGMAVGFDGAGGESYV
jgi:hypothetical protein